MVTENWVSIGSGNNLLPDGTWTNIDLSSERNSDIHLMPISRETHQASSITIILNITCLKQTLAEPASRLGQGYVIKQ